MEVTITKVKRAIQDWECSSVVEWSPSMWKALSLIPDMSPTQENGRGWGARGEQSTKLEKVFLMQ
jgi:hypothetical protein